MKKNIFSVVMLSGIWFLAACGSDELPCEEKTPVVKEEVSVDEEDITSTIVTSKAIEYKCPVTVALDTCGTLKDKILAVPAVDSLLSKVDQLIISGPLDANDVSVFLNEMTGLLSLDITETTFVENALTFKNNNYSTYTQLSLKENQIVDYMFYNAKLDEIKLPKGITSIGYQAFYGYYKSLISVTLPEGLKTIGNSAFQGNENLADLVLPSSLETIGEYAFKDCYKLTINGLPASLNTIGKYAFDECSALKFEAFPESLTSIGQSAFRGCHALDSVVLPESLTSVGTYAFESCRGLTSVTWPKSLKGLSEYVFSGCTKLSEVNLPEGLEKINAYAFSGCSSLKQIKLPESLTAIGSDAFKSTGLTSVTIPGKMTSISSYVFSGCSALAAVTLPEGLKTIGERTFINCDALTKVDFLPESLTSLGEYAFSNCDALAEVKLPEGVTVVPSGAFYNCDALGKVKLSSATTEIGSTAFENCDALLAVDFLPETVTTIGSCAFENCVSLTTVKLPNSVTTVDNQVFQYCKALTDVTLSSSMTAVSDGMFEGCDALVSIQIPESVTSIGRYAFYSCDVLAEVKLPSNLTVIDGYAFYACAKLGYVQFPASLTQIGSEAFAGCANLTFNSNLPESITSIENGAFRQCYNLKELVFPSGITTLEYEICQNCSNLEAVTVSEGTTSLGNNAFSGCKKLSTVKLPSTLKKIGDYAFRNTGVNNLEFLPEGLQTIGSYAFQGCGNLKGHIVFPAALTSLAYGMFYENYGITSIELPHTGTVTIGNLFGHPSNCLVYASGTVDNSSANGNLPNVINNGYLMQLKLVEGSAWHCPKEFSVGKVTLTKQFNQLYSYTGYKGVKTTKGKASNWYAISFPFDVQKITASDGREFAPFNSGVEGAKPFWLRKLTSNGFENATSIKAGEPYIIAFPNNDSYDAEYNVWGDITFTAGSITIPVTEEKKVSGPIDGITCTMKSNYMFQPKASAVYLLNSPRSGYSSDEAYNPQGVQGNSNYSWGSMFLPALRQSWAFEPYVVGGSASYYSVNPSTNSRSASRTLGSVPQIDDM